MAAAVATKGDILVKNVIPKHLESITAKLEKIGAEIEEFDDSIRVSMHGDIQKSSVKTMPHPGFPTDMAAASLPRCLLWLRGQAL